MDAPLRPPPPALVLGESLGTILSVWAHPDDETYLAGGLMAAAADAGQRVVCISASAGEHGTSDPATWPPAWLGPARRREAAAAMAELGVGEHHILGLPDGGLAERDGDGVRAIRRLLDEVQPDTILTFGPDGTTFHPDHVAVHRWVTEEWERGGRGCRLLYATTTVDHLARFGDLYEDWNIYMTDERPSGTAVERLALRVHLDGDDLARKIAALTAMPTQTGELLQVIEPAVFAEMVAEEAFVDANSVS